MKVLITAGSCVQAYKLEREISHASAVVFADSVDLPAVNLVGKTFVKIPSHESPSFSHQVLSICLDLGIQQVFPLRKSEALLLSEAKQLFEEYGILVMTPQHNEMNEYFGDRKSGDLIIKGLNAGEHLPQTLRGAFLLDSAARLQLFTVD